MHIVGALGATRVEGGALQYEAIQADGSTRILRTSPFKLRFDRLLLPSTATRQSICLQPLLTRVIGPDDCVAGVFLGPAYDPVRREVIYRQSPDNAPLGLGELERLSAYVAVEPDDWGFRSFEGTPLAEGFSIDLGVENAVGAPAPYDTVPTGDHFCTSPSPGCVPGCTPACQAECGGAEECLAGCLRACEAACPRSVFGVLGPTGCGSCHGGPSAAGGLDLGTPEAITGAIGRVARGTQLGEHVSVGELAPARFGRAMPIVSPEMPGNSYLVYKLLADPRAPLEVPFAAGAAGEAPPEVQRIQRTLISGMPMPPSTAPEASLRPGEAEWVAEWIFQGAPVTCP